MQLFSIVLVLLLSALNVSGREVPKHFALFMDSVDDHSIVNQSLYAFSEPCNKNVEGSVSTIQDAGIYGTYGSYTFGLGPHQHLFDYLNGRVATCYPTCIGGSDFFGGTSQVVAQSWHDYYENSEDRYPIPTCEINYSRRDDAFHLGCQSEGQDLTWSFCGSIIDTFGVNYTLDILSWSTIIAPNCTEVKVSVLEVPKYYGNETFSGSCTK